MRPGPKPTCRCWTRRPNCSASWTPRPGGTGRTGRGTPRDLANASRPSKHGNRPASDAGSCHRRGPGGAQPGRQTRLTAAERAATRPHLGLRAHRGGRGAGAVADAVAAADAPLPAEVVHHRRRHRPDQFGGRRRRPGSRPWRRLFGDRWQLEELTVNYRTPSQIAEAAVRMANAAGQVVSAPKAVREGRWSPVIDRVGRADRRDAAAGAAGGAGRGRRRPAGRHRRRRPAAGPPRAFGRCTATGSVPGPAARSRTSW